jgi:hypothetical protein
VAVYTDGGWAREVLGVFPAMFKSWAFLFYELVGIYIVCLVPLLSTVPP